MLSDEEIATQIEEHEKLEARTFVSLLKQLQQTRQDLRGVCQAVKCEQSMPTRCSLNNIEHIVDKMREKYGWEGQDE